MSASENDVLDSDNGASPPAPSSGTTADIPVVGSSAAVAPPSENAVAEPAAVEEGPGPAPLNGDFLPPNMRKHVDVKAPVPLRMMAAKGLVPLSPPDMLGALFLLTYDPDASVRDTAHKTAAGLPDRMLASGLRDEGIKGPVLAFYLQIFAERDTYAERILLNASTPDEAIAQVADRCSGKMAEIIAQNQLRVLRHEEILRKLCMNPNAAVSVIDNVCDFAVRSGLVMTDVPQMQQARVRVYGPQALESPPDPGPSAEEVLQEYKELKDEQAAPMEEGKRVSLTQRIMKMNIAQKIKLATLGNKEARSLLIRDTNKLVAVAVVRSPRITDGEVMTIANNRSMHDEVLRVIFSEPEWTKIYPLKVALVKNPKVPQAVSLKFLSTLREAELKGLSRDKNVPSAIQMMAKKMMDKKNAPKPEK